MSSDISRVYAFLSKYNNWVTEADANGDGTVIKREFSDFMNQNFEWNGEESSDAAKNDLINNFWKTIDTNQSGKISGTKLKNKNALDQKEIDKMEVTIKFYDILNEHVANLTPPNFINDAAGWKKSVSQGLVSVVEAYVKNCGNVDELKQYLEAQSKQVQAKATADYFATQYLSSEMSTLVGNYDYSYSDDKVLQNIINNYIRSLTGEISPEEIKAAIEGIVTAYLATAGLKEGNNFNLGEYGYAPTQTAPLNDLQKSVAKAKLSQHIDSSFEETFNKAFSGVTISSPEARENFKATLASLITDAKASFVDGLTQADFARIDEKVKEFDLSKYVTTDMKSAVMTSYYQEKSAPLIDKIADEILKKFGIDENTPGDLRSTIVSEYLRPLIGEIDVDGFIAGFIGSGANPSQFESQFNAYVNSLLYGADKNKIEELRKEATADFYISDSDLPKYKETCISIIERALLLSNKLQLGSTTITAKNYKDVVNTYTDGNKLMADIETMLKNIDTVGKFEEYNKKVQETIGKKKQEEKGEALKSDEAFDSNDFKNKNLSGIVGSKANIHTEFGVNSSGNIVFQEDSTTQVFNNLVSKLESYLNSTEAGRALLAALKEQGGSSALRRLAQAAWINTYNSFNSSQSNNATQFVTKVIENFEKMLSKLEEHPEYLSVFIGHTSYADNSITSGLIHYGTNTTNGNDETIKYKGGYKVSGGTVHLANEKDDPDYQATMGQLLTRLIDKYSDIDESIIKSVFIEAQKEAISIAVDNERDCPYGTDNKGNDRVEDSDYRRDWGGKDSRKGDNYKIHMDELVQLTLYCFDKLLYKKLAG